MTGTCTSYSVLIHSRLAHSGRRNLSSKYFNSFAIRPFSPSQSVLMGNACSHSLFSTSHPLFSYTHSHTLTLHTNSGRTLEIFVTPAIPALPQLLSTTTNTFEHLTFYYFHTMVEITVYSRLYDTYETAFEYEVDRADSARRDTLIRSPRFWTNWPALNWPEGGGRWKCKVVCQKRWRTFYSSGVRQSKYVEMSSIQFRRYNSRSHEHKITCETCENLIILM